MRFDPMLAAREVTPRDLEIFRVLAARQPVESDVCGNSMHPTLPNGARIRLRPLSPDECPRTGDVVAIIAGPRLIVHRVVHVGRIGGAYGYVITHGDGNWMCDPPVRLEGIAGRAEQCLVDAQWRRLGSYRMPWWRRAASWPSFALLRVMLAASPAAAHRLAYVMTYVRQGVRAVVERRLPPSGAARG